MIYVIYILVFFVGMCWGQRETASKYGCLSPYGEYFQRKGTTIWLVLLSSIINAFNYDGFVSGFLSIIGFIVLCIIGFNSGLKGEAKFEDRDCLSFSHILDVILLFLVIIY